jgi:hypothetical protein
MANANQSANRAGNVFGRDAGAGYVGNDWENIVLKPGYIIKIRDRFHLVEAVEGLTVDLFFNDNFTATLTDATTYNTASSDDSALLSQYGMKSTAALLGLTTNITTQQSNIRANMLKPSFDSGFIEFKDLEPYRGHIYHLCPSVPVQPKFVDLATGDFLVSNAATASADNEYVLPSDGGFPMGLKSNSAVANAHVAGTVSPKVYLRHPAGVPKWVLDEAPEGSSGSIKTASTIEGMSGFIDGQISPIEDPDWTYSLWIESGENNLPSFKMVNDSEELILDARLHLQGWKYRVVELGMDQLKQIRDRSGGRLTFKIVNPAGIPTPGTLLADYFPR